MRAPKLYTIRKYMGDDLYSWAVFRRGQQEPVVAGCGKSEAQSYVRDLEKREQDIRGAK